MKVNLVNIETEKTSTENLQDEFFGLDPRKDILHRVVTWQLSRKRSGTRKTKSRGEIIGSTKKIMRQKGSGGARHRTKKVNLFRGGGTAFGPKVRDHSTKLPKKIRKLGLKHALSAKAKNNELILVDGDLTGFSKTKSIKEKMKKLNLNNSLIINNFDNENPFVKALKNVKNIEFLKVDGLNVYDILNNEKLIITKESLNKIMERCMLYRLSSHNRRRAEQIDA